MPKPPTQQTGFTLIEAMITVAIVAILSAVAYPIYLEQVRKSHRADAQSYLMSVATRQQQTLLDTRGYATTLAATGLTPTQTVFQNYTLSLTVGTAAVPTFLISATPKNRQVADKCGALSIDQNGTKLPATCW